MSQARRIYEPEHQMFRDSVAKFMAKEITPNIAKWDDAGIVPRELWTKAGEAGLLCPGVPEEYGGPGCDFRYNAIVNEELARSGTPSPGFQVHSDIVAPYILHYGSEEQKRHWLPKMVSGEVVGAIAMTEPGTGSDLQSVRTSARLDGNHYVINGQKTFITNGQHADLVVVVCKTDPTKGAKGISLILVERDRPGFRRGRNLDKLGMKMADTSELFFDDVRVPATNVLGEVNRGFGYLMTELPQERLVIAVLGCSAAQVAFEWTVDYCRQRKAFGKPLVEMQTIAHTLAELKTEIEVGWAFLDQCIERHLEGKLDAAGGAMAKLWITEMQGRVMDRCLQLHGGYGYMMEYPIARAFADSRVQRIYGGTSEIMKELISRHL
jgi:alkylation response protein AidB-like acyl-CoA dehydrogenase